MSTQGKAFTQDLSPLDMLEQNSRRMADELHERKPSNASHMMQHSVSSIRSVTSSNEPTQRNLYNPNSARAPQPRLNMPRTLDDDQVSINSSRTLQQFHKPQQIQVEDSATDEWRPDSRASYLSRAGSRASVASSIGGGGILDSFRLSTLPGFKDNSIFQHRSNRDSDTYSISTVNTERKNQDYNDTDEESDAATIQEPSPVEPVDSNTQFQDENDKRLSNLTIRDDQNNAAYLSPRSSISDTASVYTAKSHLSLSSQLQSRPRVAQSASYTNNTLKSPQSPTGQSYFFPHGFKSPNGSVTPSGTRTSSGGSGSGSTLLVPPKLRSTSSNSSTPTLGGNRGFDSDGEAGITNKLFKDMTLEEHVTTGIALHEAGNLREASYHWQYAAFKGETTAMLLYGLALRHGWGVRKNPTEAVKWLRNAMESSLGANLLEQQDNKRSTILSISDDEGSGLKKAHIGLALYELGMSYLHSWGTDKDEELALKTFEMAGSLGDADALCEAAALYMKNGPKGRKKDLQKAARLYREAGERGANMVGQSWIYKDKYMKDEDGKKKKKK